MAKSFKARYAAALAARESATDSVYAAAYPRRDVVFSQCLAMAAPEVRAAYSAASAALASLDHEAEQSGRAYRAREDARSQFWAARASARAA